MVRMPRMGGSPVPRREAYRGKARLSAQPGLACLAW
jgi:hypothetical protein